MTTLQKKMSIIGRICFSASQELINSLRASFKSGEAKLVKIDRDNTGHYLPLIDRLIGEDEFIWSTYDGCLDVAVELKGKQLICELTMYDGRLLDGLRTDIRFSINASLPLGFLNEFSDRIEAHWQFKLGDEYRYAERRKK
jgi:hypothetical protein